MGLIRFFEAPRTNRGNLDESEAPEGVAVNTDSWWYNNNKSSFSLFFFYHAPQKHTSGRWGTTRVCWRDARELRACRVCRAASVQRWTCTETGGGGRGRRGRGRGRVQVEGEFTWEEQTELQWSCDGRTSSQTALKSRRWADVKNSRTLCFLN